MARAMGLVDASEYGGCRAKNFAVLMFAEHPQDFIPYARIEIIREVDSTDKMESKVFDGPVWLQVQQARRYFEQELQASYTIRETGAREHRVIYNWPHEMFDELVTNCVLHKEYDTRSYIGVYVYPDKMTFVNHNRPLPPVTIKDLNEREEFDDREYLNPELRDMFFALNLVESYGSGIRRAKRAMATNGSPALVFVPDNETDDYTMAIAYINEEFARIRAGESIERAEEIAKEKQKKSQRTGSVATDEVFKVVASHPQSSAEQLAVMLETTPDSVRYHLRKLRKSGLIEHVGPTKGGSWKVRE